MKEQGYAEHWLIPMRILVNFMHRDTWAIAQSAAPPHSAMADEYKWTPKALGLVWG